MDVFGQGSFIRAKVVVKGHKWLYLGKSYCFLAKAVVFEKKWLYSAKVVAFGQSGFIRIN